MRLICTFLMLLMIVPHAWARNVVLAPEALEDLDGATLQPGDRVMLSPGEADIGLFSLTVHGSAEKPIMLYAKPGTVRLEGALILEDSHHIIVEGLTIHGSSFAGIILRDGTEAVTLRGNELYDNRIGIWIGDNARAGHRIEGNHLYKNSLFGVGVDDKTPHTASEQTLIAGNRIADNGSHGIEITGNRYVIERNLLYGNGWDVSGSSNIHLYAGGTVGDAGEREGLGDHNIIRYNVAYGGRDEDGIDGNGFQADMWCDDNEIHHNVFFANDGAGISLYSASRNRVFNNTLYGNGREKKHFMRMELLIGSDLKAGLSQQNDVRDNLFVSNDPATFPVYFFEADPAQNRLMNNLIENRAAPGALYRVQRNSEILPVPPMQDRRGTAEFVNAASPETGGLRLQNGEALGAYTSATSGLMP